MRVELTPHAVERYRERHRPNLSHDAADRELRLLVLQARATKALTVKGQPIWHADGGVRLVVKYDKALRLHVIVTVLPKDGAGPANEEMECEEPSRVAEPAPLPKAEESARSRALEWELAQAHREVSLREREVTDARERCNRAATAYADAEKKLVEAKDRLSEVKEREHG